MKSTFERAPAIRQIIRGTFAFIVSFRTAKGDLKYARLHLFFLIYKNFLCSMVVVKIFEIVTLTTTINPLYRTELRLLPIQSKWQRLSPSFVFLHSLLHEVFKKILNFAHNPLNPSSASSQRGITNIFDNEKKNYRRRDTSLSDSPL